MDVETRNEGVELNPFLAATGTPKKKVVLRPKRLAVKGLKGAETFLSPPYSDTGRGVGLCTLDHGGSFLFSDPVLCPEVKEAGEISKPVVQQPGGFSEGDLVPGAGKIFDQQVNRQEGLNLTPQSRPVLQSTPKSNPFLGAGTSVGQSARESFIRSLGPEKNQTQVGYTFENLVKLD